MNRASSSQHSELSSRAPVVKIVPFEDRVVCFKQDGTFSVNKYQAHAYDDEHPFSLKLAPLSQLSDGARCFDATAGGKYVVSGGYVDCSLRIEHVDNSKIKAASIGHRDVITCVSISGDGTLLFFGI